MLSQSSSMSARRSSTPSRSMPKDFSETAMGQSYTRGDLDAKRRP
jgi:hypothetical protein